MSKVCMVTGKRPVAGNNVSHAKNRFVKLKVSANGMRIIDKKGIDSVLAAIRHNGIKV